MRARTSLPARTHTYTHTHTCCLVTSSRVGHHLWTMKWSRAVCGSSRPPVVVDAAAPGWSNDGIGFRNSHLPGSRRHHPVGNHQHHSSRQDFICPSTVDSADTYICCAYSPRCFIIQKVKPTGQTAEEITLKENTVCREIPSPLTSQDDGICDVASNVREVLSPVEGDTISKPEVVFPAMEDTPEITASFPSEATSSTAAITLPTVDSLAFPGQSHVDAYPSSLGQVEGTENNGNCGEKAIPLSELKAMLRQQLEYYFSRENLATDAYLLSQMDSDQYVPISTIAKFNQIRRLTEDINLIVEVLRESALVQVDEAGEKVRPNPRSYVLILREIPETTPMKELEDLFSGENCPKFSRLEFAHNNSWYVLFESDEDTHKAYRYLREEAKTFKGKPIMARIKARLMTSVPFPHSFKNGICTTPDADGYSSPQLTQQTHVQYTYTNVPNEGYNNQQVCPPFYPPTMLQAWAPTTPACVDLGTVFSMNGLSPQAAFRPLNNSTSRHNYSSRDRQMKTYNPQQNYNFPRTEQTRYFNRGQSTSYLQRQQQQQQQQQQHSYHNLMNTAGTCGFDYMAYSSGSRNLHSFGMDLSFYTAPNLFFRRPQGPSSVYPAPTSQSRHNPVLLARNQMGLSAINGQDQNYLTVGGGVLPFAKDSVLSVAAGAGKQCSDSQTKEPWVPSQRPRSRRWWKENGTSNSSKSVNLVENSNGVFGEKSLGGGDVKPESPKFDLETTSFPPLPGCLDTDVLGVDVYESRLSDIVKGTVKPTTRDSKTQTSESALSPCAVMKDSSTLTIEEAAVPPNIADGAFTPPTSPVVLENVVSSEENDITADKMENDKCEEQQHGAAAGDSSNCSNLCSSSVTVSPIANATATFSTPHTPTTSVVASSTISSLNTTSTATTIVVATSTSLMTCLEASSPSDALINVPNNVEIKHTPPKLPKSKQVDTLPKMKSTDLPSPKSKSVDLVTSKNKLDTPKEKAPAVNKHKSSCISISKQLESSLIKERSTDMSLVNNKIEVSVLKNSDVFPPKEKQIQPHMSKTRTLDSSASKAKSLESDPPPSMLSVNGHMDSESTPSSEDEKPFRKLTYSEVAMRAKEKVEKLAQELKEKERQEALVRHHRQQEMATQNKLAATRGPFRDFPKGRIADQQRSGYREWRERRKMARAVSLPTAGQ